MYPGVESLSGNVKMGLQMKMKRGELVGFNGCFGYDYHQDTKTITVNETEAETVRLIYDMYLQGIGSGTIAKRLVELGIKNKRGTVEWHDHQCALLSFSYTAFQPGVRILFPLEEND